MGNVAADGVCQHKSSAPQGRDCALSSPGHRKGRAHSPAGAGDCRAGLRFRLQPVGALDRYAFSRAGYSTRTSCYLGPAGNGLGTHENTCMALIAFLIALPLWPNYLAIALPGMPWITLLRIIGAPMILLLLIALSVSAEFRRGLCASLDATAPVWKMLVALVIIQFLSLASTVIQGGSLGESLEAFSVAQIRSEEHTSELQSLMRISYAVFCLKKKNT